jgi:4-alpha-glucanotransferase
MAKLRYSWSLSLVKFYGYRSSGMRKSGILLHLTSLPSPFGIGDLGASARDFLDFLEAGRQSYWQILPLNPPLDISPYSCVSSFAGNSLLISPEGLRDLGLLTKEDLLNYRYGEITSAIDYKEAKKIKKALLKSAYANFTPTQDFENFCEENKDWLLDYALFMSLWDVHGHTDWQCWKQKLQVPLEEQYKASIQYYQMEQFLFQQQWQQLKAYAQKKKIKLIGDLPIFVSLGSHEVWRFPHLFLLNEENRPDWVAGVPPDYFSLEGQKWDNPLYDWEEMMKEGYSWWIKRLSRLASLVDIIRLDHFRGLVGYYAIPAQAKNSKTGEWRKAPGQDFLIRIFQALPHIRLLAEDLGYITPDVIALKAQFKLPGMAVLEFILEEKGVEGLKDIAAHTFLYTGTHDNNTLQGWIKDYKGKVETDTIKAMTVVDLLKIAVESPADTVIIPAQDLLCLDSQARMNTPGTTTHNWSFCLQKDQLGEKEIQRLKWLNQVGKRNKSII